MITCKKSNEELTNLIIESSQIDFTIKDVRKIKKDSFVLLSLTILLKKMNMSLLDYACKGKSTKIAQILIHQGFEASDIIPGSKTCLHYAAESGDDEQIQLLLDANIPVDIETTSRITPLICAVKQKKTSSVRLLLDNKANVNHMGYVSSLIYFSKNSLLK